MELLIGLIIGAVSVGLIWIFSAIGKVQEIPEPPASVKERLEDAAKRRADHLQTESEDRAKMTPAERAKHTEERLKKYEKNN